MERLQRPEWVVPVAVLACLISATVGAVVFTPYGFAAAPDDFPHWRIIQALAHWDAGWYADIARDGYWYDPAAQGPVAFFPGYPLLIRALTYLGANRWVAGVMVTLLCGPLAVLLFGRWAKERVDAPTARLATLLLAVYPFTFYLYGVVYSDALFLLLAVCAFLFLERDQPLLATLFGALATACRPVAPAVVLGLWVRSLERRRKAGLPIRVIDWLPALSGLGLLAYMVFLQVRFGDPLAFAHVQGAPGWDGAAGPRTWLKLSWFHTLFPRSSPLVAFRLGGHALVTLGALALVPVTFRRLGLGYGVYVLIAAGLPALSSKDFQGLGRYLIAAFPLFLTLALLLKGKPKWKVAWLAASAALLVALAAGFGAGGYVA